MNLSALTGEDKALLARLEDLRAGAQNGAARFTPFLSERHVLIAQHFLNRAGAEGGLFGGYPGALRQIAGFFPSWMDPPLPEEAFPIRALTLVCPRGVRLTHRDVLGSLMSLRLTRESIGDILCEEGRCVLFALESVAPVILDELVKVGGVGVRCEQGSGPVQREERFDAITGTVPSPRLDCLARLLTGKAREKSAGLIEAGLVTLNHTPCENLSQAFREGDLITIRGYGKFRVTEISGPTKKGRLRVVCDKFL